VHPGEDWTLVYLKTVTEADATGDVARIYEEEIERYGFVMEATRVWTTRPEMLHLWEEFYATVRSRLSLSARDWKLITLVAAKHVPSTYCSLVYGRSLVDDLGSPDQIMAVSGDYHNAGLSDRDVAMLEYAEQITRDASQVTEADIAKLRDAGFSDEEIYDIAMCASLRNFMSRFYDALGATPDADLREMDTPFRDALTVGRRLPDAATGRSA
jgi:uncharacterized peroxidase-related enzyme